MERSPTDPAIASATLWQRARVLLRRPTDSEGLLRGSLKSVAIKGAHVVLQLAASVALGRLLGPDGYGAYAFALALVGVLVVPAHAGFPGYLLRRAATHSSPEHIGALASLVRRSTVLVATTSLVVAAVAGIASLLFGGSENYSDSTTLLALTLVPLLALIATKAGVLRGLGSVVVSQVPENILRPALLLVLVVAFSLSTELSSRNAIVANIVATGASLAAAAILLARSPTFRGARSRTCPRTSIHWVRDVAPFMLLAGTQHLNHHVDILMLGVLADDSRVGLYRVAVQIADGMGLLLVAVTTAIAPHLARLHHTRDFQALQRVLVTAHRGAVGLLLPLALVLILGRALLLPLLFGEAFLAAQNALAVLLVGKVLYASVGFSGAALSMFGRAWVATLATTTAAFMNAGLNLALIPRFGIEGAAFATAVSGFLVPAACALWMYKVYGHDFSALGVGPRSTMRGKGQEQ